MLSELEAGLGYTFRDKSILENALTHSSYANENRERGLRDNERLEATRFWASSWRIICTGAFRTGRRAS